jgi:hypothetical protein
MSTLTDGLQVIDKFGIVAIDSASKNPGNLISAESGGTAQPAVSTGAPGFRTTVCGLRRRLDLGSD